MGEDYNISKKLLEAELDMEIESIVVKQGSNLGDNYATVVQSVDVYLKNREQPLYFVVKVFPNNILMQTFLNSSNIFHTEVLFYDYWLPKLMHFQQMFGINPPLLPSVAPFISGRAVDNLQQKKKLDAEVTEAEKSENTSGLQTESEVRQEDKKPLQNFILMVDIRKTYGFKMADRFKGFDHDHVKLVIEELAKLHALGWAVRCKTGLNKLTDKYDFLEESVYRVSEKDDKQKKEFQQWVDLSNQLGNDLLKEVLGEDSELLKGTMRILQSSVDILDSFLAKDGTNEEILENFLRIKPDKSDKSSQDPWLVTCHGDCWLNNMLFLYDEETQKPKKLCLLDLQLFREACPTTDLAYFFYTSTDHHYRKKHLDAALQLYHDKFSEFCHILQTESLPGFNLNTLKRRFNRAKVFGLQMGISVLQLILKDKDDVLDLETVNVKESEDVMETMKAFLGASSSNKCLKDRLVGMIEEFYEAGVV